MSETQARGIRYNNFIFTLIWWSVLCGIAMGAMLYAATHKTIVIADSANEQSAITESASSQSTVIGMKLLLERDDSVTMQFTIPLGANIKAENVVMENHYMERELWIYIAGEQLLFFQNNAITGDFRYLEKGWFEAQENGVVIKLQMSEVLEYYSTMENQVLQVAFSAPRDAYPCIVVIDPCGGGSETGTSFNGYHEKDFALQVSKLIQKKIEPTDIKLYFTRTEDVDVDMEQKLRLIRGVQPDMYLGIGFSADGEHPEGYGIETYYNDEYFIPDFGNVQWADTVTQKVTISASNRALGLLPAEEESILKQLKYPAAHINMGYLSNDTERSLLQQESYREKLAQGIADAILEVYTMKGKTGQTEGK